MAKRTDSGGRSRPKSAVSNTTGRQSRQEDPASAGGMLRTIRAVIRSIPRGKVATYGDIAEAAGYPGAARQVVWALRSGDAALPWHRVIGAGGRIRLPGAQGLDQRLRLQTEGVSFEGARISMKDHRHDFGAAPAPRTGKRRE